MGDARRKGEWSRTCEILAMLYNVNRGKDQPARAPKWFMDRILNPRETPTAPTIVTDDMTILKTVFIDQKIPSF